MQNRKTPNKNVTKPVSKTKDKKPSPKKNMTHQTKGKLKKPQRSATSTPTELVINEEVIEHNLNIISSDDFDLESIADFESLEIDESLISVLAQRGFTKPTTIQSLAIPAAIAGHDVLGSAPTGTGKSIAFLIPAIQHLIDFPRKHGGPPRVLVLAPTRELASQIAEEAERLCKNTHLSVTTITGGVSYVNHAEIFSTNQDIVVATTGRLLQYIKEENFDCRAIEILILDEADRLLDMGFAQDIETIAAETRWRKQTMLFSATLEGNDVEQFATRVLNNPIKIEAHSSRKERKKITQYYYRADDYAHKLQLLAAILQDDLVEKAIVFVRKREKVHQLSSELQRLGLPNCYLEGELAQIKRQEAIKRLNSGKVKILVATDIAARGIDIPDVTHVINFDMARTADVFLHRIGRTARAGKKGTAISLVEAHDFLLLKKTERYLGEEITYRVIEGLRPKSKTPNLKHKGKASKKVKKERAAKKKSKK